MTIGEGVTDIDCRLTLLGKLQVGVGYLMGLGLPVWSAVSLLREGVDAIIVARILLALAFGAGIVVFLQYAPTRIVYTAADDMLTIHSARATVMVPAHEITKIAKPVRYDDFIIMVTRTRVIHLFLGLQGFPRLVTLLHEKHGAETTGLPGTGSPRDG